MSKKITISIVLAELCTVPGASIARRKALYAIAKITALLFLIGSMGLWNKLSAQEKIRPVRVWEKLPESFWLDQHQFLANGKTYTGNLSAYRNKVLIIDFWATWCSTCFIKMPMLDSVQKAHPDLMQVVLVNTKNTGDHPDKIKARLKPDLPTIYLDSTLISYFPHHSLPQYIWINGTGHVTAITDYDFINRNTLDQQLYRQRKLKQRMKLSTAQNEN